MQDGRGYTLIPKREFNPELSAFSNLLLDLVDFKDRVRPIANDISRHDAAFEFQKRNVEELQSQLREFQEGISEQSATAKTEAPAQSVEEGYSSLEIAAESEAEAAEEPAAEMDAAEIDHEAAIEDTVDETAAEDKEEDQKKE